MNSITEIILELKAVNKLFPGVHALKDVSFQIKKNTIHGLVGENGAGKSTLIKLLSGVYTSDSGDIFLEGEKVSFENPKDSFNAGISTIYQELSVIDALTVAQDLFFGNEEQFMKYGFINYKKMNKEAEARLKKIGFNLDVGVKVETLSVSQKQQLEIAKSLMKRTKIILMDEPTSALTKSEVEKFFHDIREIKQSGVSIIYISHHLDEIFEICDYVTVLKDGAVVDTKEIKNIARAEVVKMMVGKDIAGITTNRYRNEVNNEVVLDVKNYSTSNGVKNVNIQLHLGEIVGIYGALGSKRTELLKSLYTGLNKTGGECFIRSKKIENYDVVKSIEAGMGFLPENRKEEGVFLNLPIVKNIPFILYNKNTVFGFLRRELGLKTAEKYRDVLRIKTPSLDQIVNYLSGGNQQKVVLAKLLAANCEILMLDEPLVGIDVGTKNEILNIINDLANNGKSIIIVSSELSELLRISDRILIMRNGTIIKEIEENYDAKEIVSYAIGGITV